MATEKEKAEMLGRLTARFGDAMGMLAFMILELSLSGQPCDVTFRDKPPALNVKIDQKISLALMYGAGAKKLQEMLTNISLSNGDVVSIGEIWVVHPMPVGGIPEEELAAVDLAEGEQKFGPNGETLRETIRDVYHCKSKEEEEKFLRRYLAS
jgi:hypothetical protein